MTTRAGIGALLMSLGIALHALAAHALESILSETRLETFKLGAHYLLLHSIAILALCQLPVKRQLFLVLLTGIALFSGSLCAYALFEIRPLVFVTPLGGVLLISAWALIALELFRSEQKEKI